MLKYAAVSVLLVASPALAQSPTVQQKMSLADCVASAQPSQTGVAQAPVVTVDTPEKKELVVTMPDGKVTVTCDALTQQATTTYQR